MLREGLESGALVAGFEMLARRKPGLPCDVARLAVNETRNRYRDISPCEYHRYRDISPCEYLTIDTKPGLPCDVARLAVNKMRNRYRDISPSESSVL